MRVKIYQCIIVFIIMVNKLSVFALPKGFVYLKDIDSTIVQNLRYYTKENFIGKRIDGYKANKVILTIQAAEALSKVQKDLLKKGYSLVVYDAYRPERAVAHFVGWSQNPTDQQGKQKYYPMINKEDCFKLGYISSRSYHSRGSTVDVTIIKLNNALKNIEVSNRKLTNGETIPYLDDGTVDMGSSFDLFGKASHHDTDLVEHKFLEQRNELREIMKKNGFNEYSKEWWHYTLDKEPFPDTYFDFEVE
jgi:D-alanyl-D-alanine dipeptidase